MTPKEIHQVLIDKGNERSLPEFFKDDLLVHDLSLLEKLKTQDFLWVLRTCGTWLFSFHPRSAHLLTLVDSVGTHDVGRDDVYWFHFHDGQLEELGNGVPGLEKARSLAIHYTPETVSLG